MPGKLLSLFVGVKGMHRAFQGLRIRVMLASRAARKQLGSTRERQDGCVHACRCRWLRRGMQGQRVCSYDAAASAVEKQKNSYGNLLLQKLLGGGVAFAFEVGAIDEENSFLGVATLQ